MIRRPLIPITSVGASLLVHAVVFGGLLVWGLLFAGEIADQVRFARNSTTICLEASISEPPEARFDFGTPPASGVVVMQEAATIAERRMYREPVQVTADEAEVIASVDTAALPPVEAARSGVPTEVAHPSPGQNRAPQKRTSNKTVVSAPAAVPTVVGNDDTLPPSFFGNPPPTYPAEAYTRGWSGELLLRLTISAGGEVRGVELVRSSGHSVLDAAAVSAVRRWRGQPATRGGVPVATTCLLPVRFKPARD